MRPLFWNRLNIEHLLALTEVAPGHWRTQAGDAANLNGRSYGGQLLAQALMAGLMDVPTDRAATMMQFLYLQGAVPDEPLNLHVTRVQEGKRFSSRSVRGTQDNGRVILDAQVTCARALDAPSHGAASHAPKGERPENLLPFGELDPDLRQGIEDLSGYSEAYKPSVEYRIPEPQRQFSLNTTDGRFRFWIRTTHALPDDLHMHAAAFAYESDWWVNLSALRLYLRSSGQGKFYATSLNHAIWLHQPFRADQWVHVEIVVPASVSGRGLSVATVHDQEGVLLATVIQECLITYAD